MYDPAYLTFHSPAADFLLNMGFRRHCFLWHLMWALINSGMFPQLACFDSKWFRGKNPQISLKVPFPLKHPPRQRKTWIQELQEGSLPLKSATQFYIEGLLHSGCNMTEFTLNRLETSSDCPILPPWQLHGRLFSCCIVGQWSHSSVMRVIVICVFASATLALRIPFENPNPGWTMKRAFWRVEKSKENKKCEKYRNKDSAFGFSSGIP